MRWCKVVLRWAGAKWFLDELVQSGTKMTRCKVVLRWAGAKWGLDEMVQSGVRSRWPALYILISRRYYCPRSCCHSCNFFGHCPLSHCVPLCSAPNSQQRTTLLLYCWAWPLSPQWDKLRESTFHHRSRRSRYYSWCKCQWTFLLIYRGTSLFENFTGN
jgi:hypothetical protein